ncbi:hypothetical protein M2272_005640 [Mycobacterium frederiksbergense]|uniref:Intersectin-EH binding protein Ibp1 n=1 Tax=Mycolicibacterium frederiksbergense TaxID=117567 RepID=A0ABT6L8S5_9MYCO|nr:hypothetical protein [Mycolicibacterium frederiksbergense]MDH6198976.1 hypothetical protein [Mycolicibacterium frederiksbergense]
MVAQITSRRLIITALSALAFMAPATVLALPAAPALVAACPNGEDTDTYTGTCVPYLVPNSANQSPLCPAGVLGTECGSAEVQTGPGQPQLPGDLEPTGPGQEIEDLSTPDF